MSEDQVLRPGVRNTPRTMTRRVVTWAVAAAGVAALVTGAGVLVDTATGSAAWAAKPAADASPAAGRASAELVGLVDLLAQRIAVGDVVAASKFPSGAIEDLARETVVLDTAATKATAAGLDPAVARAVFADQIAASKVVQHGLFSAWLAHPDQAPTTKPDLATVRPVLDALTDSIVAGLVATRTERAAAGCGRGLTAAGKVVNRTRDLDRLHREALDRALASLCT